MIINDINPHKKRNYNLKTNRNYNELFLQFSYKTNLDFSIKACKFFNNYWQ